MFLVVMASGASAPGGRVSDTGPLTATALIVTAVFAALVIVAVLYGARQKRIRAAAEEAEKQRASELATEGGAPKEPVADIASPPPPTETIKPVADEPPAAAKPNSPAKLSQQPKSKPVVKAEPVPTPRPKAAAPETTTPPTAEPAPAAPKPPPSPATAVPASYALIDVKGLGPKAAGLLTDLGIADVAALAALDPARAAEVDGQLGTFAGRLTRDRWVEQAKLLAAGDIGTFEATYGKL